MEVILDNLVCSSVNEDKRLNNVSFTFHDDSITFSSGLSGRLLRDLLLGKKQKLSGSITLSEEYKSKDIGYVGNNPIKEFKCKTLLDELNKINEEYQLNYENVLDRCNKALIMVGLNESYAKRLFNTLSSSELKKVHLAVMIFHNPKVIIVDYYEKGLNYKDIDIFKRLLKKLVLKYHKNIIVFSDDIEKYLDVIDRYVIFDKGKIVVYGNKYDLYNEDIYKYIKCPNIIKFVKKVKDNNVELLNYIDIKELIKAIYRDVENK